MTDSAHTPDGGGLTEAERFELAEKFRVAFDEDLDDRRVRDTWLLAADTAADWFAARATHADPRETVADQ